MKKAGKKVIKINLFAMVVVGVIIVVGIIGLRNKKSEKTSIKAQAPKILAKEMDMEGINLIESEDIGDDGNKIKVPVPKGYSASHIDGEMSVDGGFVIYEGEDINWNDIIIEGEEDATKEKVLELQKTRNQYVWIPVKDVERMYGIDKNGKVWGKLYNFNSSGRTANNWEIDSDGYFTVTSATSHREPGLLTSTTAYDLDSKLQDEQVNLDEKTRFELKNELESQYYEMVQSIATYGGFYVGRYETGGLSNRKPSEAVVRKGRTDIGNVTWYAMYESCKALQGNNNDVKTRMITGSEWDEMLQWLQEMYIKGKRGKSYSEINNSASWGNYKDSNEFEYTDSNGEKQIKEHNKSVIIPTGSAEYTKANNIYDIAGNVWEWAIEANSDSSRVCRGGCYNINGYNNPARYRYDYNPKSRGSVFGCRSVLYIE